MIHRRFRFLTGALLSAATVLLAAEAALDFTLKPVGPGKAFKLSEAKGNYVALHFLLKTECPVCLRFTRGYALRAKELPEVTQVFIKPDTEAEIQQWAGKLDWSTNALPIYRDPDAALAKRLEIPDGYAFHNQTVHYPALVLLDPAGKEVFRYVGRSNTERYSFDQLKAKLAELRGETAK